MEVYIAGRHGIDIDHNLVPAETVGLRIPALTLIIRNAVRAHDREVTADGLLVERRDRMDRSPVVIALNLEGQRILVAVIIDVDNRIAFRRNGNAGVVTDIARSLCRAEVEARILIVGAVDPGITVVAGALRGDLPAGAAL